MRKTTRRAAIVLAGGVAAARGAGVRDQLIGVWRLHRYELKDKVTGVVTHPYTEKPHGRLAYDSAGRMSAQLMRPGRKPMGGDVPQAAAALILERATEVELREMAVGFLGYYGTYRVVEAERKIIHKVEACLIPNWVGTELRRGYELEDSGRRLTLIAETPRVLGRLAWLREAAG